MNSIIFQYYSGNIHESHPRGWVNLDQFLNANRSPKEHTQELFRQIAYYSSVGDMTTKAKLKERLYSFTPCVHISEKRAYKYIVGFTGLLVLDFDKILNATDFKDFLFQSYNCIIASWLSPSKMGVKALVKIPVVQTTDEFKELYFGIAGEMWQYNGFDGSGQNAVLPLFQSWDEDMLIRNNPTTWVKKGVKIDNFQTSAINHNPVNCSDETQKKIIKIINTGINKITDNGHPQLRGVCIAVGGYVANNYINYQDAITQIFNRIENNSYLKKGIPGYKKTAEWAVNYGLSKPLEL